MISGYFPDHQIEIRILPDLAVDREPDPPLCQMADSLGGRDRGTRGRLIERLADFPRLLFLTRSGLQIASRHVEPDGIAENVSQRSIACDLDAARLHRHHQLQLVLEILRQRWVGNRGAIGHDRVSMLGEEKRRLLLVVAKLTNVFQIVTTDAVDTANRKALLTPDDGQRNFGQCERAFGSGIGRCRPNPDGSSTSGRRGASLYKRSSIDVLRPIHGSPSCRRTPAALRTYQKPAVLESNFTHSAFHTAARIQSP